MHPITVAAVPGSLRRGSYNRAALTAAAGLAPDGMEVAVHGLEGIPLYDADLEREHGFPATVAALRETVAAADALLIATPEYNFSVPGVLKNAVDWLSRGPDSPLDDKPAAILGAGGRFGTLRAQLHLREVLLHNRVDLVASPQVAIDDAWTRFDDRLGLADDRYRRQIAALLEALAAKVDARRSLLATG